MCQHSQRMNAQTAYSADPHHHKARAHAHAELPEVDRMDCRLLRASWNSSTSLSLHMARVGQKAGRND